jgi:predicted site-specific integrase-resolvase
VAGDAFLHPARKCYSGMAVLFSFCSRKTVKLVFVNDDDDDDGGDDDDHDEMMVMLMTKMLGRLHFSCLFQGK